MFQDLNEETLNTKTLNYGVITLVPKVKEINNIRQYMPICLLNVDFKGITKTLNNVLVHLAEEVIGANQT